MTTSSSPGRMGHFRSRSRSRHPAEVWPSADSCLCLPHRLQRVLRTTLPDHPARLLLSQRQPRANLAFRGGGAGTRERGVSDGVCG